MRTLRFLVVALTLCALNAVNVGAQGEHGAQSNTATVDIITPHITDSRHIEYPCFKAGLACELELPQWEPIHLGGMAIDISPTKHVVMLIVAALLCLITLLT